MVLTQLIHQYYLEIITTPVNNHFYTKVISFETAAYIHY